MAKKCVAVIFGGCSSEHEVSCVSVQTVIRAMDKDKYEIDMLITIDGTLYPIEIKKTATPGIADAKNFFITQRIKNIKIADPIIICNCSGPVMVGKGVTAIPVDWV